MAKKQVFNRSIKNLLEVGVIQEYLEENYQTKQISVRIIARFKVQPLRHISIRNDIFKLSAFLKDNLNTDNLHIVVWEI